MHFCPQYFVPLLFSDLLSRAITPRRPFLPMRGGACSLPRKRWPTVPESQLDSGTVARLLQRGSRGYVAARQLSRLSGVLCSGCWTGLSVANGFVMWGSAGRTVHVHRPHHLIMYLNQLTWTGSQLVSPQDSLLHRLGGWRSGRGVLHGSWE